MPYELPSDAVAGVVRTFQAARERLAQAWREHRSTDDYLRSHSALLDAAVRSLAELAELPTDRLAIEAVGGFGRRELFPYSDIDLLVLLEDEAGEDPILAEHLSAFLSALWELGLTVGAAVRTRTEFTVEAGKDVSIATTYLESAAPACITTPRTTSSRRSTPERSFATKCSNLSAGIRNSTIRPMRSNPT